MSKAYIAQALKLSLEISGPRATQATNAVLNAIVERLQEDGFFTISGFGTFTVRDLPSRISMNPRTGGRFRAKASRTVRFKAAPNLRSSV